MQVFLLYPRYSFASAPASCGNTLIRIVSGILALLLLAACPGVVPVVLAQQEVFVDQFTGTAHVGIPLGTASIQGARIALGLEYAASGVKVDDTGGYAGMSWSITGVPVISRVVRGLPDEISSVVNGEGSRTGWLIQGTSSAPGLLTQLINGTTGTSAWTCLNGLTGSGAGAAMYDSEPDIFSYSLPGHAGKFVFDENGTVRTIPYDPIVITRTSLTVPNGPTLPIGTFTIRTPEGATYTFSDCDYTTRRTILPVRGNYGPYFTPRPRYFKKEFDYFKQTGGLTYATTWHITRINNRVNESIAFTYGPTSYIRGASSRQTAYRLIEPDYAMYSWEYTYDQVRLLNIVTPSIKLNLEYITESLGVTVKELLNSVSISSLLAPDDNLLKNYALTYQRVQGTAANGFWTQGYYTGLPGEPAHRIIYSPDDEPRYYLVALDITDHCAPMPGYRFSYQGISPGNDQCENMAPPGCGERDYWGYSKPSQNSFGPTPAPLFYRYSSQDLDSQVPGAPYRLFPLHTSDTPITPPNVLSDSLQPIHDQTTFESATLVGTLTGVRFPAGARATFSYEPKWFYDSLASRNFAGGGARIKEVRFVDNLTNTTQVRAYGYLESDAAGARSSGRLLRIPQFVFLGAGQGTGTDNVLSCDDLNHDPFEGRDLGYRRVTETVTGHGRTVSTFALSATADTPQAGANGQWSRSLVQVAQGSSSTLNYSPFVAGYDIYPFPPATNYDYVQGKPLTITREKGPDANGAYARVHRTTYAYKLSTAGRNVAGVAYEVLLWTSSNGADVVYAYAPYRLLTDFTFAVTQETDELTDQTAATRTLTRTTAYGYNARGRLATVTKREGSGNAYRTRYKYAADYPYPAAGTNLGTVLDAQFTRQSTAGDYQPEDVVETLSELITPNGSRSVLGVSWNTFKAVSATQTRPYQTWSWQATPGVAEGTTGAAFESDSVAIVTTGGIAELRRSIRFRLEASVEEVSDAQAPISVETRAGRRRHGQHLGYGQTVPVLQIDNALASEVVFSNFETIQPADPRDQSHAFEVTGGQQGEMLAHTGRGSLRLTGSGQYLQTALPLPPTSMLTVTPAAFRFSFWAKARTIPRSLTAELRRPDNSVVWTTTAAIAATANWEWHELLVDVHALAGARDGYHLQLRPTSAADDVLLDDVLLLPFNAMASSTTYNATLDKTTDTDASGHTTYYDYDQAGQVRQVRDFNGHIVRRTEQAPGGFLPSDVPQATLLAVSDPIRGGLPIQFKIDGLCTASTTPFEWDFGDGTSHEFSNSLTMTHVFAESTTDQNRTVTVSFATALHAETPIILTRSVTVLRTIFAIAICQTGVSQYDLCIGSPDTYTDECNDPTLAPQSRHTVFRATVTGSYQNGTTYAWYRIGESPGPNNIVVSGAVLDVDSYVVLNRDTNGGTQNLQTQYFCVATYAGNLQTATQVTSRDVGIRFYRNGANGMCPSGQRSATVSTK